MKQSDIKPLREEWLKVQQNLDPITGRTITRAALDHDHTTGHCRAVLDYNVNQMLGKCETAWKRFGYEYKREDLPDVLEGMAEYLRRDYSMNPVHPKHVSLMVRRFSRMNAAEQTSILMSMGVTPLLTKAERTKQYRKLYNRG